MATARRRLGASVSRARPSTANARCGMSDAAGRSGELVRGRSVRFRLLAIALLPMLVILPLLLGVAIYRWNAKFDATLISKVNGDLTIAHQYLARILEKTGVQIRALSLSARFHEVLAPEARSSLQKLLDETRREIGLDFLYLTNGRGDVLASSPPLQHQPRSDWPIIMSALSGQVPATGVDIFGNDELAAISPALAERARLDLVPTPNAVPTDRSTETRGMVVHAASRAMLPDGGAAALVGGTLLNQNLEFIDTINDLVYRAASLPEGSQGTATLFLDDVRISTNVRLFEGRRALGTRVSAAVWARGAPGSTVPSWSMTGTSPPTSRWSTVMASGSACSMSASWRSRSAKPNTRHW